MAQELTKEQVLLLNNLMYVGGNKPFQSITKTDQKTVGDYIDEIPINEIQDNKDYGSYMTGKDWKNLINAIKSDDQLMNMQIVETHVDNGKNGGDGISAVFVQPETKEAVVAFRGTSKNEWKDNFTGGGPTDAADGVSTFQQENALEWYQSLDLSKYETVTVTGHSKGGNKAKYITVLDNSVDRCLSFDGQGFSDEFIKKYSDEIAWNQGKIFNSNVDKDYVNLLLNDIGNTTFYKGYDYGAGGFLENHCPNTFCNFHSDGTFTMRESTRDENMAALDEMLNSYLRTLSPEDKKATLELIGNLVEKGFNGADINEMLDILLTANSTEYVANMLAYLVKYIEENPELLNIVGDVLKNMNLGEVTDLIVLVLGIVWQGLDNLADALGWVADYAPDSAYEWLEDFLKKKGIDLSADEIERLMGILQLMSQDMDNVKVNSKGSDIAVPFDTGFSICIERNRQEEQELKKCSDLLKKYAENVHTIKNNLPEGMEAIKQVLEIIEAEIRQQAEGCNTLKQVLEEIHQCYLKTEKRITASISI